MTDKTRILKKNFGGPNLVQNLLLLFFFCHFIEFGSYVFLGITYSDSLRQCLISVRDKTPEKSWGHNFGPSGPKLGPKLNFSTFF